MTAILLILVVLLVLAALAAGAALGVRLERQVSGARAEGELARALSERDSALTERDAAQDRLTDLTVDRDAMLAQFQALSRETAEHQTRVVDDAAARRFEETERLLAPVAVSLQRFEDRLTAVEKDRVEMATDLRAHVRAVRDTGEALRRETNALVTALRKPQVRGSWGETQLRRVAEIAGMLERCDFDLQATTQSEGVSLRPDMRVNLAEGKHVFVDAKVPLSAFLEAAEATDDATRAARLQAFGRHVRGHVDQLSAKRYWKTAESPEFVVLFLPSEAFFVAALEQVPDLHEYAAARDVVIATPTTLIAMLRAVAYGWKQAALAETAAEVFRLGRELHERLGRMGQRFDKLGRALRTAVNAYNDTVGTVEGSVLVQARRFRDLRVSEQELDPLATVDDPVRQLQAEELLLFRSVPEVAELVGPEADDEQRTERHA